jgi:NADH:ubiquinone oxidoreductase subunit E
LGLITIQEGKLNTSKNIDSIVEEVLADYKGQRGELIKILQEVQAKLGYLPEKAMLRIARFTRVPESHVFGVASFYSQFRFTPLGRKRVLVCQGTACHVRGAPKMLEEIERHLGIKPGETTTDQEHSLDAVACIGACALAPTMMINADTHGKLTQKKVAELLSKGDEEEAARE